MSPTTAPRYDRIVPLIVIVLLGLAVIFLIDTNPYNLRARLGGDLPTITLSWMLIASLVVIVSAGADLLARAHPQMQMRSLPTINLGFASFEIAPNFWVLPSFSVISSFAFFRLFSGTLQGSAFAIALVAAGGLLFTILIAQHYTLDRNQTLSQQARLVLQIIAYLLVFGCFSAIYNARFRTLYSASLVGSVSALVSYALLCWTRIRNPAILSLLVGVMLGEVTWALNYWATPFLLGGALMLVIFYVATSLLQHKAEGPLERRLLIEYGILGSILLAVVVWATFRN